MKIEKNKPYNKMPVVIAFKTSTRSNAKVTVKVINTQNVDYILSESNIVGVPKNAEILDVGIGMSFVEKYKNKYNI